MANRDISLTISARDQASAVFGKVGAAARKMFGGINDAGNGLNGLTNVGRFFAGTSALAGGMQVVAALSAQIRGDNEAVLNALERMPFGLGQVARGWQDVLAPLLGVKDAMDRLEAQRRETATTMAETRRMFADEDQSKGVLKGLQLEGQRIAVSDNPVLAADLEKSIAFRKAEQDFADAIKNRTATVETAEKIRRQAMANAAALYAKRMDEIDKGMLEASRQAKIELFERFRDSGGFGLFPSFRIATEGGFIPRARLDRDERDAPYRDAPGRRFLTGDAPAFESRFLRGNLSIGTDPSLQEQKKTAENTKKTVALLDTISKLLPSLQIGTSNIT